MTTPGLLGLDFLERNQRLLGNGEFFVKALSMRNISSSKVRSDHGGEFIAELLEGVCEELGIQHQFYAPITP